MFHVQIVRSRAGSAVPACVRFALFGPLGWVCVEQPLVCRCAAFSRI